MKDCNSVKNPMVPGQQPSKDEKGVKIVETHYKSLIGKLDIYHCYKTRSAIFSKSAKQIHEQSHSSSHAGYKESS